MVPGATFAAPDTVCFALFCVYAAYSKLKLQIIFALIFFCLYFLKYKRTASYCTCTLCSEIKHSLS